MKIYIVSLGDCDSCRFGDLLGAYADREAAFSAAKQEIEKHLSTHPRASRCTISRVDEGHGGEGAKFNGWEMRRDDGMSEDFIYIEEIEFTP